LILTFFSPLLQTAYPALRIQGTQEGVNAEPSKALPNLSEFRVPPEASPELRDFPDGLAVHKDHRRAAVGLNTQ